jgi:hypothetical protein
MPDARPELVTAFFRYHRTRRDDLFWAWEEVTALVHAEPEAAWPLVRTLVAESQGETELYYVAAGPLEDFLALHGKRFLQRILADADADDQLRRALGGVWGGERMDPEVWRAIQAVAIPEGPLGAHAFQIEAPPGWTADDTRGRGQTVFHPHGADARSAPAVLLVDAEWRDATVDLETHVARAVAERRRDDPTITAEDAPPVRLASGAPARTLRVRAARGAWAVAFVDAPLAVYELVLAAENDEALDQAWPAFVEFAASFRIASSA